MTWCSAPCLGAGLTFAIVKSSAVGIVIDTFCWPSDTVQERAEKEGCPDWQWGGGGVGCCPAVLLMDKSWALS